VVQGTDPWSKYNLSPIAQEPEPATIDSAQSFKRLKNADGSTSTIRTMSFEEDGREVLIPTVVDGEQLTEEQAIARYRKTGQHFGKFNSVEDANAEAKRLHEAEEAKLDENSEPDPWSKYSLSPIKPKVSKNRRRSRAKREEEAKELGPVESRWNTFKASVAAPILGSAEGLGRLAENLGSDTFGPILKGAAQLAQEDLPLANPKYDDTFLTTLSGAGGSAVGFATMGIAGGGLGRLAGVGRAVGATASTGITGALSEGAAMQTEAEMVLAEKVAKGEMSPREAEERAMAAFGLGLGIGATELVPFGRMFGRLNRATRGSVKHAIIDAVIEGVEEGGQEALQALLEDKTVRENLLDQEIALLDRLGSYGENAAAGAIVGSVLSTAFSGLAGAARKQRHREALARREVRLRAAQAASEPQAPQARAEAGQTVKIRVPEGTMQGPAGEFDAEIVEINGDTAVVRAPGGTETQPVPVDWIVSGEAKAAPAAEPAGDHPSLPRFVKALIKAGMDAASAAAVAQKATRAKEDGLLGATVLEVEGDAPLPADGWYDPKTRTVIVDKGMSDQERRVHVLAHELLGHHSRVAAPAEWLETRAELERAYPDLMAAFRAYQAEKRAKAGLPDMSIDLAREEGVAQAAEEVVAFTSWALLNQNRVERMLNGARKHGKRHPYIRRLIEWLGRAARSLGLEWRPVALQFEELAAEVGRTDFEKASPEVALDMAQRLSKLVGVVVNAPTVRQQAPVKTEAATATATEVKAEEVVEPETKVEPESETAPVAEPDYGAQKAQQRAAVDRWQADLYGERQIPPYVPGTPAQTKRARQKANRLMGQALETGSLDTAREALSVTHLAPEDVRRIASTLREAGMGALARTAERQAPVQGQRAATTRRQERPQTRADRAIERWEAGEDERFSPAPPVESMAFKRWFGQSHVIEPRVSSRDASPERPMTVYWGGVDEFTVFDPNKAGHVSSTFGNYTVERPFLFFAEEAGFAELFAGGPFMRGDRAGGPVRDRSQIKPLYLSIQKPLYLDENESDADYKAIEAAGFDITSAMKYMQPSRFWQLFDDDNGVTLRAAMVRAGFDGARMVEEDHETGELRRVWVALNPSQAKSIHNAGTWAGDDIRYSVPPVAAASTENIPGKNSNVLRWLQIASPAARSAFHASVSRVFVNPDTGEDIIGEEMRALGINAEPRVDLTSESAYRNSAGQMEYNPADQVSGFPSREAAELYALLRGYYTYQEAVAGYAPNAAGALRGFDYEMGMPPTREQIESIFAALGDRAGDFAFYPTKDGFALVHLAFDPSVTPEIRDGLALSVASAVGNIDAKPFNADTFYHENPWQDHPNGERYQEAIASQASRWPGGSDLLARLDRRLGEPLQAVYEEYAAQGFGEAGAQPGTARSATGPRRPELSLGPIESALATWAGERNREDGWLHKVWAPALARTKKLLKPSTRNFREAARRAVEDIHGFLVSSPQFLQYYREDWQRTRAAVERSMPEVRDRPELFVALRLWMGLLSPGTQLDFNVREALRTLREYAANGNLNRLRLRITARGATAWAPGGNVLGYSASTGPHKARTAKMVADMFDERGIDGTISYLQEEVPIAELATLRRELGFAGGVAVGNVRKIVKTATGQNSVAPRMFIFGPKVGAYTLNSLGDERYTTTDIWEGRFIRSYFRDVFGEGKDGLPTSTPEYAMFQEFSTAFKLELESRLGIEMSPASLQALRWFYIIDATKRAGYAGAKTSGSISSYVEKHLDRGLDVRPGEELESEGEERNSVAPPTDSPKFWQWFGGSKVVDQDGKPLVAYHGTTGRFTIFETQQAKLGKRKNAWLGSLGSWFAAPSQWAGDYDEGNAEYVAESFTQDKDLEYREGAQVMPVYLSIQRPMEFEGYEELLDYIDGEFDGDAVAFREHASQYYDGILVRNSTTDGGVDRDDWVAFRPEQVKSAIGNRGTFDPADPDIRYSIPAATFTAEDETRLEAVERNLLNQFNPLTRAERDIAKAGRKISDDSSAALATELFPGLRAETVRKARLKWNALNRLKRQHGLDPELLDDFLRALHAFDRNAVMASRHPQVFDLESVPGSGSDSKGRPLTNSHANRIIAQVNGDPKAKWYKQAADIVHEVNRMALQERVDSGILSDVGRDEWVQQLGENYVPLRSAENDEAGLPKYLRSSGFSMPKSTSKRAEGRKTTSGSPTVWSFMQFEEVATLAAKNRVGVALSKLVAENPNPDLWEQRAESTRAAQLERNKEYEYRYHENGEPRYIVFKGENGKRLTSALKKLGGQDAKAIERVFGPIGRVFTALATRFSPEFLLRNAAKDIQTAMARIGVELSIGEAVAIMKNSPKAMKAGLEVLRAERRGEVGPNGKWHQIFREWREQGGQTGWADEIGYTQRLEAFAKMRATGRLVDALQFAGGIYMDMQDSVEFGTRVAAYAAARSSGLTKPRAASFSRNITVDFNRRGEMTGAINSLYWFFNASVQGSRMVMKTVATPRGAAMAAGIVGLSVLNAIWNYWMGEEDDYNRADEISEWQRNAYMTWLLPDTYDVLGVEVDRITIPVGWGYNLFWAMGQQIERVMRGKDEVDALGEIVTAATEAFSPLGATPTIGQAVAPSILDPFIQVSENTSWSGSSIMPNTYGRKADSWAVWPDTSPGLAKAMQQINEWTGGSSRRSGWFDVSPETVDYLVKSFGSGTGQFATRVTRTIEAVVTGGDLDARDVPFLRSFVTGPNAREVDAQFRTAIRDVENTMGEVRDGVEVVKRRLIRLDKAAKSIKKRVEALKDAGRNDEARTLERAFLSMYRTALEER